MYGVRVHNDIATMKLLVLLILSVFLGSGELLTEKTIVLVIENNRSPTGSCFKPVRVGDLLPSGEAGSVSGLVFLLDHTTLYIRDFQFQVQGTGQFSSSSCHVHTSNKEGNKYMHNTILWKSAHRPGSIDWSGYRFIRVAV